jgi:hypothetical protein
LVYVWGDGERIKFFKLRKRGKGEKREGRSETCLQLFPRVFRVVGGESVKERQRCGNDIKMMWKLAE